MRVVPRRQFRYFARMGALQDADVELLRQQVRSSITVTDSEWARFLAGFAVRELAEDAFLLRAGERAHLMALVTRGILREFYVTPDGKEATRTFCTRGMWSGSLYDLLSHAPSITSIQALEATRLLVAPYAHFEAMCERNPMWHRAARLSAEALYVRKVRREFEMLTMNAAERYRALQKSLGVVAGRIPQRHLASCLGITPEHLSRIRRRQKR